MTTESMHLKAYHTQYHQLESEDLCHQRHLTYGEVSDSQRSMVSELFDLESGGEGGIII